MARRNSRDNRNRISTRSPRSNRARTYQRNSRGGGWMTKKTPAPAQPQIAAPAPYPNTGQQMVAYDPNFAAQQQQQLQPLSSRQAMGAIGSNMKQGAVGMGRGMKQGVIGMGRGMKQGAVSGANWTANSRVGRATSQGTQYLGNKMVTGAQGARNMGTNAATNAQTRYYTAKTNALASGECQWLADVSPQGGVSVRPNKAASNKEIKCGKLSKAGCYIQVPPNPTMGSATQPSYVKIQKNTTGITPYGQQLSLGQLNTLLSMGLIKQATDSAGNPITKPDGTVTYLLNGNCMTNKQLENMGSIRTIGGSRRRGSRSRRSDGRRSSLSRRSDGRRSSRSRRSDGRRSSRGGSIRRNRTSSGRRNSRRSGQRRSRRDYY
jgi:hypothetical protein